MQSAPEYKFYALPGGPPLRPGMVRVEAGGGAIEMEIWDCRRANTAPAPLGIGMARLAEGGQVQGFVCEAAALAGAEDITRFGGWRAYLAGVRQSSVCAA
ncbi:MAG: hypothetical protein PHD37_00715 [Gallionellaceae bacterium]|nr:hypothetical protein [Gallionellaceae bacterium]